MDDAERGFGRLPDPLRCPTEGVLGTSARIRGEPLRERDLLVVRVVEQDDELRGLTPDLLDPVTEALRNEAHVPAAEPLHFHTAMGPEDADASPALRVVLPLGRVRMPVQLPERAGLEVHSHAGERRL